MGAAEIIKWILPYHTAILHIKFIKLLLINTLGSRDSVVGIAAGYGLEFVPR
jgi:hypothetical protein